MNFTTTICNSVWLASVSFGARRWYNSINEVEIAQTKCLKAIVVGNRETAFGQEHQFREIHSISNFQQLVPIRSYEDLVPYVKRIEGGENGVLTSERVQRFGVTSGSTMASKLVPYTKSLIAQFQEGIAPWIFSLMTEYPSIIGGKAYWSVTPVGVKVRHTQGGIPIGFDDEKNYLGVVGQSVFEHVMAAPSELALVSDMDSFRYATLRFLLQERGLTWISVWNPSFLSLLLSPLYSWADRLIWDIRKGALSVELNVEKEVAGRIRKRLQRLPARAEELGQILSPGKQANIYEAIWPNLRLISCWADGNAQVAASRLQRDFSNCVVQPKGLMATEAFVSFPLRNSGSALSVNSHFFEFEEDDSESVCLAHQLNVGKRYSVIVTTGGGFYRYRLNDVVEVVGFKRSCPLICFVGRKDKVVDVCGEKMNEVFVGKVLGQLMAESGIVAKFAMIAPDTLQGEVVRYVLFLQFCDRHVLDGHSAVLFCQRLDGRLRENFHYDYCRRLGQLEHCALFLIDHGQDANNTYLQTCGELGQRIGDVKQAVLHPFQKWMSKFNGKLFNSI
ncbi:MAG: GH3 auxin-responsive promoter family protein [bacterium]|nr:GH3 auxin-responsive promoter family protein [bacterium]